MDKAKNLRSDTDDVLIVEGYMDVVSVYASGIKNVIANSGTALTERQISLIWKFFSNPIICFDGDDSGQKAALRIAVMLFPLINVKNKIFFSNFLFDALHSPCSMAGLNVRLLGVRRWHAAWRLRYYNEQHLGDAF